MRDKVRSAEREVARIAGRQHGVIAIRQLLGAGLSRNAVSRRVEKRALHREFRGVYRVGHQAPHTEARYLAAVLACGEDAVLSGHAAACLLGLIRGAVPPPEVSTPADRQVVGVITRRVRRLDQRDVAVYRAIPVTTGPRTLVDLAASLSLAELARACHEAQVRYRITRAAVDAALARKPNAAGAAHLDEIFGGRVRVTLSKLEQDFLTLLKSVGLPLPQTNRSEAGHYVDCRWPERRLTVELDSYRYHHSRHAWEQDRHREREAYARGDEFRRYTYGDVAEDQSLMLAELTALLAGSRRS